MQTTSISLNEARRIALSAQGFGKNRNHNNADWRRVRQAIQAMQLLQIDTINTVIRSHYLPIFSRIGSYDKSQLEQKAFSSKRRELFEYWGHEASLLPLSLQPLLRWRMTRAQNLQGMYSAIAKLAHEQPAYIKKVCQEIKQRGPISARELSDRGSGGGWWQWHDGKTALEYLFWTGQVTIATRRGFERVYDLTENVLPTEIMALPTPSEHDAQRQLILKAAQAHGIATESDLRDYFRLSAADSKRCVTELIESGDLTQVQVDTWTVPAYTVPDTKIPRQIQGSALLSPFDPLIWERRRTERLFNFSYRLEIYKPESQRRYGYYVLPFLCDEALVARVDLKADRAANVLRVLASHGEENINAANVAEALSEELRRLATWLELDTIEISAAGSLHTSLQRCFTK